MSSIFNQMHNLSKSFCLYLHKHHTVYSTHTFPMDIKHLTDKQRFYVEIEGHTAHVDYNIEDGGLDIRHTIVPNEIGGRGIAAALVRTAYDYALQQRLQPVATCSYAVHWLEKHPEYKGQTGADYGGEGTCAL